MEDGELDFPLEHDDEGSIITPRERRRSRGERGENQPSAFPLSSSTPSSLGELSATSPGTITGLLSQAASSSITASSSSVSNTETTLAAPLKPKPLLSLVKSLSTEISQREPDVCLAWPDSKLRLQPWKQPTQAPKPVVGNVGEEPLASTAPSSPVDHRPSLPGSGGSIMAELEDTRRKLSEAMHEPLSMLSKLMGEEGTSPRAQRGVLPEDPLAHLGPVGGGKPVQGEDSGVSQRPDEAACETPPWKTRRGLGADGSRYEIRTCGDVMQVVEIKEHGISALTEPQRDSVRTAPEPGRWLACVGLLAYAFFVLPLSSYLTGLSLGLACGFMMGLGVVLMLSPRRLAATQKLAPSPDDSLPTDSSSRGQRGVLQGWMNEMHTYNPETYHPSLCHPVHATLESCRLRLAYPRSPRPQRGITDEPPHDAMFASMRCFWLTNSKVCLLPAVLAKKRMWNRKYPICIAGTEEVVWEEDKSSGMSGAGREVERAERDERRTTTLFLFGRTGREKEEWYQHLVLAARTEPQGGPSEGVMGTEQCSAEGSLQGSTDDLGSMGALKELAGSERERTLLDYSSYMACFVAPENSSRTPSPCPSQPASPTNTLRPQPSSEPELQGRGGQPAWLNALVGRVFWDFLREQYWAEQVAHKIQKKLSRIRLPYFMNELTLAELDMGTCMPQVLSTSRPSMDHRGLWLELEVVYTGSLQMTLETKMNLCKLGKENVLETDRNTETNRLTGSRSRVYVIADSDEESSSAGSSDEEDPMLSEFQWSSGDKSTPPGADGHGGGSRSRKILRFVDKMTKSKYFQKATENEYIKRKIAEVSNTPLLLTVEVLELSGTLAVNIPPPPTDRIWYSFRVPPRLDLSVRPMLGEREVTFTHVTEWIERKLQCEFQKVFVMPNMDDLYLPLMSSGVDSPAMSQHSQKIPENQDGLECRGVERDMVREGQQAERGTEV